MTLRVVFFGSGSEYSRIVLDGIRAHVDVVGVVLPGANGALPRNLPQRMLMHHFSRAMRRLAHDIGARVVRYPKSSPPVEALLQLKPDLIVVASFPFLLPEPVLQAAPLGALNVHPSLLPAHRGADPLFWSYFLDEPSTGASLHWVDRGVDSGDLVAQEPVRIERGASSRQTAAEIARAGVALLAAVLPAVEGGHARGVPQAGADADPLPGRAGWTIDWETWPAERVWHFLSGVGDAHGHRLKDRHGSNRAVGRAIRWSAETVTEPPGTIRRRPGGWMIACRGGYVYAARPPLLVRAYRALSWLRGRLPNQPGRNPPAS